MTLNVISTSSGHYPFHYHCKVQFGSVVYHFSPSVSLLCFVNLVCKECVTGQVSLTYQVPAWTDLAPHVATISEIKHGALNFFQFSVTLN